MNPAVGETRLHSRQLSSVQNEDSGTENSGFQQSTKLDEVDAKNDFFLLLSTSF